MKDTSPHLSPLCPPLEPSPVSAQAPAKPASDKSVPSNPSAPGAEAPTFNSRRQAGKGAEAPLSGSPALSSHAAPAAQQPPPRRLGPCEAATPPTLAEPNGRHLQGGYAADTFERPTDATLPRFARALRTEEMTSAIAREAIEWQNERNRRIAGITKKLPLDLLPSTGMYAIADDNFHVAAASLYLEKESPVAVCGFLFVNPDAPVRLVRQTVRLILAAMPVYAKKQGAKYLISTFGRPSFNRILDQIGFVTAETAENKIMKL